MAKDNGLGRLTCEWIEIEIESMRVLLDTGACKAFAKVRFKTPVGSVSIDNFRLIETKKGELFVSPPSHKKGERFFDDVTVTEDLEKVLRGVMVKTYQDQTKQR